MLGLDVMLGLDFISGILAKVMQIEALNGLAWFGLISSSPTVCHEKSIPQDLTWAELRLTGVQPGPTELSLDQVNCSWPADACV